MAYITTEDQMQLAKDLLRIGGPRNLTKMQLDDVKKSGKFRSKAKNRWLGSRPGGFAGPLEDAGMDRQ